MQMLMQQNMGKYNALGALGGSIRSSEVYEKSQRNDSR